jgi:hypothetical protein
MSAERIETFKKTSNHFKKASNSLKISLKCHAFLKKSLTFSKISLAAIDTMASPPLTGTSKKPISKLTLISISDKIILGLLIHYLEIVPHQRLI